MANEVTINIESSLAAMAYVLADQQKEIQNLREASQKMYSDMEALVSANKDIANERAQYQEDLQDAVNAKEELTIEHKELSSRFIDLTQQCKDAKSKNLKWIPYPEEGVVEIDMESESICPCVIIKTEQVSSDCYYVDGKDKIPVGHVMIEMAPLTYPSSDKCRITEPYGRKILAYCIVNEDNFVEEEEV